MAGSVNPVEGLDPDFDGFARRPDTLVMIDCRHMHAHAISQPECSLMAQSELTAKKRGYNAAARISEMQHGIEPNLEWDMRAFEHDAGKRPYSLPARVLKALCSPYAIPSAGTLAFGTFYCVAVAHRKHVAQASLVVGKPGVKILQARSTIAEPVRFVFGRWITKIEQVRHQDL